MKEFQSPQLVSESFSVPSGSEWIISASVWWMLHLQSGSGYVLSRGATHHLEPGAIIRLSPRWEGTFRASQLSPLQLQAYQINPQRLVGLITLPEEQFFAAEQSRPELSFRIFFPTDRLACSARELFASARTDLNYRVDALRLFLQSFEHRITAPADCAPASVPPAAERLRQVLREIPALDLADANLNELVARVRCTPRHFSRLFRELTGVSFRQKQIQLRLEHARHLLARTETKVVDIAYESGFGSVSLFNSLFKRQFRVPPRRWRETFRTKCKRLSA